MIEVEHAEIHRLNVKIAALEKRIKMLEGPTGPVAAYHDATLKDFDQQWCVHIPGGPEVRGLDEDVARLIARALNAYLRSLQCERLSRGDYDYFAANMGGQSPDDEA